MGFYMGVGHSDSGSHVYEADILLAEPSPQSPPPRGLLLFHPGLPAQSWIQRGGEPWSTYPVGPGLRSQALARSVQ